MKVLQVVTFIAAMLTASFGVAQSTPPDAVEGGPTCNSARVFERMFSDICWDCMLPIAIGGIGFGQTMPSGANRSFLCMCDPPFPGITMGAWFPVRIIEAVKTPSCSPTFGGIDLQLGSKTEIGGTFDSGDDKGYESSTFRHVHHFAFPVGEMLGLIGGCNPMDSFDLLYVTELVPTWNDDVLAFYVNPETAVFANPVSQMACMTEAVTTGIAGQEPNEGLFWCAGSWGNLYPMTGTIVYESSPPADTSLMGARMLAQIHRWGYAQKTMGNSCGGDFHPMLPKNQYRFQQYWPAASVAAPGGGGATGNHWIGESDFRWGVHKNIPAIEDYLHLVFRWNDCCLEFW